MKRALCLIALAVMLLGAGTIIPPFPYINYEDVPNVDVRGPVCDGSVMLIEGPVWRILSSQQRDMFIHKGPDGEFDYVYFVVGASSPVHVRFALTIDEAKRRYANPCVFFEERDA